MNWIRLSIFTVHFQKVSSILLIWTFLCAKRYFVETHLYAFVVTHEKKSKINLIYISMWMHSERNAHNYIISHISISLILGKNRVFLAWMIARHFKITIFASHLCVYPKCNAVKCRPKHTLYLRSDFETKTIRSTQRFILSNSKSAEFQLWANKIRPERERVLLY